MARGNINLYFLAAHCVYIEEAVKSPSQIMIYLGKTRLDKGWTNSDRVQTETVTIFFHCYIILTEINPN